jgi:ABC-type uncharacterized transport system involved in gliding motility auxiliary subunit
MKDGFDDSEDRSIQRLECVGVPGGNEPELDLETFGVSLDPRRAMDGVAVQNQLDGGSVRFPERSSGIVVVEPVEVLLKCVRGGPSRF